MPPQRSASLDALLDCAQGYAEYAMRNIGHVPPALLAESPVGSIHFMPDSLEDERSKNTFANTARLICVGYGVTAAVLVVEAWMKVAKPGERLDPTERPSEAFDRCEIVMLMEETAEGGMQRFLRIIRTDASHSGRSGTYSHTQASACREGENSGSRIRSRLVKTSWISRCGFSPEERLYRRSVKPAWLRLTAAKTQDKIRLDEGKKATAVTGSRLRVEVHVRVALAPF